MVSPANDLTRAPNGDGGSGTLPPFFEVTPVNRTVDPSRPAPTWLIALLASVTATGPLSMQIFLPALPAVQQAFEVDPGTAQLTLSVSMLAVAAFTLVYGPLSDRFGRRPVLLGGLVVFLLGSVLCVVAPTIDALIVGRVVQGAGGAAGMVLARAIARDLYGPSQAAVVIAKLTMIMVIAPMVAPAIGGLVNDLSDWRVIFVVVAIAGVAIIVATARQLPESVPMGANDGGALAMLRGFVLLLSSARFCLLALFPACSSVVFFSFVSGAPYVMVVLLDRPATEYGLYFMVVAGSFMLGNFVTVRLGGRIPLLRMMTIGSLLMAFGVALTGAFVAVGVLHPLTLFLPVAVSQLGQGMALPNAQAAVINLVPHRAGTASAVTGFLQMLAAAGATQLVGSLQNGTAWPLVLVMAGGVAGALTVLILVRTMLRVEDTPSY